ncbi:hypothetical protein, partial [Photorhabdus kayaii]|uniref:hypothetical protein n=1 Tax=Photorhabdus kayaii TaxID=230088 RepID=UPI0021D50183
PGWKGFNEGLKIMGNTIDSLTENKVHEIKKLVGFALGEVDVVIANLIPKMIAEGRTLEEIHQAIDTISAAFLYSRKKLLSDGRKFMNEIVGEKLANDLEIATLIKENKFNWSLSE